MTMTEQRGSLAAIRLNPDKLRPAVGLVVFRALPAETKPLRLQPLPQAAGTSTQRKSKPTIPR